jgi:hypothetical protein
MTALPAVASTLLAPHVVLAAGLVYTGTISCTALLAVCGRTPQIRRDARRVLALLLRRNTTK